jgi:hypothetical protein
MRDPTLATQQRAVPSRTVQIVFVVVALIATACAWSGLSLREVLATFGF